MPPAVKDCFGLHGHSAFGSVANKESGVGQPPAVSLRSTILASRPSPRPPFPWLADYRLSRNASLTLLNFRAILPHSSLPSASMFLSKIGSIKIEISDLYLHLPE